MRLLLTYYFIYIWKNYRNVLFAKKKKIAKQELYSISESIALVKNSASAKFTESIEAHIALNINPKYTNQQLRTTLVLPHGTGKSLKISVLATNEQVLELKKIGINVSNQDELLRDISNGILNFDLLIATPTLMPKLAKFGRILGPKGLMPSPKAGTVTDNLESTINEFNRGKFEYRTDKMGVVHVIFGKSNFSEIALKENLKSFYHSIEENKPLGVRGQYIKNLVICSTMGPAICLNLETF